MLITGMPDLAVVLPGRRRDQQVDNRDAPPGPTQRLCEPSGGLGFLPSERQRLQPSQALPKNLRWGQDVMKAFCPAFVTPDRP